MDKSEDVRKVAALEADILELEAAIKGKLREKKLLDAWRDYQKQAICQFDRAEDTEHTSSLENQIKLLSRLTDVEIDRTHVEIVQQGRLLLSKRVCIDGSCMGCKFLVEMTVTDSMDNDGKVTSTINSLQIEFDAADKKGLLKHVKILEEEGDIQGYFTLLRSYMRWQQLRDTTFQHFCSSYPDIVTQVNQQCLQIQHIDKPCVFKMEWTCSISQTHVCYPEINLSVKMDRVSAKNEVLSSAPDKFQLMLKELGIEKSISCVVMLCSE